jgi:hypothetical protein
MKEQIHMWLTIVFLLYSLAFGAYGIKKSGGYKTTGISIRQSESLTHAIVEPWKTKYRWGGIVQLILLISNLILQFL